MRRKIFLLLPLALLSLTVIFAATQPSAVLTYPTAGLVFSPGQAVNIQWRVDNPDGQKFCEQEIFMKVDGTRYQISPELSSQARSYRWIVPNVITNHAVIHLHLGCERPNWEASFPQPDKWFIISSINNHK
jgi:hypothetical protein